MGIMRVGETELVSVSFDGHKIESLRDQYGQQILCTLIIGYGPRALIIPTKIVRNSLMY